jgi:exosortase/archaeosortase family protein
MASARISEAQKFGLRFFAILATFSVLAWVIVLPQQLTIVQEGIAGATGQLARLVGSANVVRGDHIQVPQLAIHINHECTGIYVLIILVTFLFAYPAPWSRRLTGAVIGVAALTAVNVLRLVFLVRIAELQPGLFEYFHEYVWQGFLLVLVIAYAMTWVERAT